jgi:hypothetical protein
MKIFEKLKEFFAKLFKRKDVKLIEASKEVEGSSVVEPAISQAEVERPITENETPTIKKERDRQIFVVYENVKKGIVKLDDLMIDDLIKIQLIMESEVAVLNKKIRSNESEIQNMQQEIALLTSQNEKYERMLQNNS